MKKLPLGIQTFSKLREENCLYIDKTEKIYQLLQGFCYFFARPRRFGKSILCSTIASIFQGKKELFDGLWIKEKSDYSWPVHPVIHIDFGKISIETPEFFRHSLMLEIRRIAALEFLPEPGMTTPGDMIQDIMLALVKKYNNKKVVLIIDEYDRPILHHLTEPDALKQIQVIIRDFYTCIKAVDAYLQFLFVTGISRFTKTNLFSGFNQIKDISMDPAFAHLVGYTEEELDTTLLEHMIIAADRCKVSLEAFKNKTKEYYDGYRFWEEPLEEVNGSLNIPRVYNPYSVMNNLAKPTFAYYWFESGTPTFLIQLLKNNKYPIESFDGAEVLQKELSSFEPLHISLKVLLYQAGYLTIKNQDSETNILTLTYPNLEVKDAFLQQILAWLAQLEEVQVYSHARKVSLAFKNHDLDALITTLKSFYAAIPYTIHLEHEKYYQTIFYTILKLLGMNIQVEIATNIGRIDAVIKTDKFIYIIEFKLETTASKALEQIKTKKYFEQYQQDPRAITLIGITFSTQEKNINNFKIEELKK